jgi:hypothetical protein
MVEAQRHGPRSDALAALAVVGQDLLEQAQVEQAERVRAAAEAEVAAAAAAAAVEAAEAAERLRMEERRAEVAERQAELALEMRQLSAQLGVVPPAAPAPQPQAEEELCVVCMDAPKRYAMVPCLHVCVCEACARQLLNVTRSCPVCREPIQRIGQAFF